MHSNASVRTFIASRLGDALDRWLEGLLGDLSSSYPKVRWARPGNVHLTFRFLGNVAETRVPDVVGAMRMALEDSEPLSLALGRSGSFGRRDVPRVFWLALEEGPALDRLKKIQAALEENLLRCGFSSADRPWTPHITLGRNPRRQRVTGWEQVVERQPVPRPGVEITEWLLCSSQLTPQGPNYEALARLSLGGDRQSD